MKTPTATTYLLAFSLSSIINLAGTLQADESSITSKGPQEKAFKNNFGIQMIKIEKGNFTMGSPSNEESRGSDEEPKTVTISQTFWIAETELTQKQSNLVMEQSLENLIETKIGALGRGAKLKNKPSVVADDHPMCFVSYADAIAFCKELTEKESKLGKLPAGYAYNLPTEAQWEYAARAGTSTVFAFGDSLDSTQANFYGPLPYNSAKKGEYREKTTAVKSFKANPWGLYDMHGNVYEWCLDWYSEQLKGGADPSNLKKGDSRCIRGGAWNRKAAS